MAAVLVWAYVAILRRVVRGTKIPAILVLATLGLTVRTLVGLGSGSTFAYFIQPIATTVALAVRVRRLGRHRPPHHRATGARLLSRWRPRWRVDPAVLRLFGGLTLLWAVVHIVTAAVTFGMLTTMPVATFVAFKTSRASGVTIGCDRHHGRVGDARRADRERLVFVRRALRQLQISPSRASFVGLKSVSGD